MEIRLVIPDWGWPPLVGETSKLQSSVGRWLAPTLSTLDPVDDGRWIELLAKLR